MFSRAYIHLCSLLLAAFLVSAALEAHAPDSSAAEEIEELEFVEEVVPLEAAGGSSPGLLELVGRLHPLVVHFPIAWLVLLLIVESATFLLGRADWQAPGFYLLAATLVSFVPAIATGLINLSRHPGPDPAFLALALPHRNLNSTAAALCLAAFLLRWKKCRTFERMHWRLYFLLLLAAGALVMISGHLGGKMVYGENYLPF